MRRVYAEVGIGNESFLSTEIEQGKKEYREKNGTPLVDDMTPEGNMLSK